MNPSVSQERDEASLESAEAAFDLAFGLGSRSDKVNYAKAKQGTLELASRIALWSLVELGPKRLKASV
ncbi:MAG: hypothetical protein ACOYM3_24005 [Terrimicrobiaceae bacterium]